MKKKFFHSALYILAGLICSTHSVLAADPHATEGTSSGSGIDVKKPMIQLPINEKTRAEARAKAEASSISLGAQKAENATKPAPAAEAHKKGPYVKGAPPVPPNYAALPSYARPRNYYYHNNKNTVAKPKKESKPVVKVVKVPQNDSYARKEVDRLDGQVRYLNQMQQKQAQDLKNLKRLEEERYNSTLNRAYSYP